MGQNPNRFWPSIFYRIFCFLDALGFILASWNIMALIFAWWGGAAGPPPPLGGLWGGRWEASGEALGGPHPSGPQIWEAPEGAHHWAAQIRAALGGPHPGAPHLHLEVLGAPGGPHPGAPTSTLKSGGPLGGLTPDAPQTLGFRV